jgi:hypothetical protein
MIRTRIGMHARPEMATVHGTLRTIQPRFSNQYPLNELRVKELVAHDMKYSHY